MEKEFKHETKIGQKVFLISIGLYSDGNQKACTIYKEGVHIEELKIVFQTEYKIALNDKWITCLDRQEKDKRKDSIYSFIGYSSIFIKTKETYAPNGIFARIYVLGGVDKEIKKLKAEMVALVEKEYGFLANGFKDKIWAL